MARLSDWMGGGHGRIGPPWIRYWKQTVGLFEA